MKTILPLLLMATLTAPAIETLNLSASGGSSGAISNFVGPIFLNTLAVNTTDKWLSLSANVSPGQSGGGMQIAVDPAGGSSFTYSNTVVNYATNSSTNKDRKSVV